MKKKIIIGALSAVMSLGVLTACNTDQNNVNDPEDVNYRPVRYHDRINDDLDRRNDMFDRDIGNRRMEPIYNRERRYMFLLLSGMMTERLKEETEPYKWTESTI